jgi:molybdate transport system regulatory protein
MLPSDLSAVARIWLERRGAVLLGEREAVLLGAIDRSHSIKQAAKAAGVSYRTAWARLQSMQHTLGSPVVQSRAGGPGGGTTQLTDDTRALLQLYGDLSRRLGERAAADFREAVATRR